MPEKGPSILSKALQVSAKALDSHLFDDVEKEISNGQLLLKLLDKNYQIECSSSIDESKIWTRIQNRIEEIFAPGLIQWEEAKRPNGGGLYSESYNKDKFGLSLLALFVCCVFDQNKDVYSALYLLEEKAQQRIRCAFQYLIGRYNIRLYG